LRVKTLKNKKKLKKKIPFIPGKVYKRSLIHDEFGGSRQSGIAPCANLPYIFIFSGASGTQYGYKDRWENDQVFSYTGEGQKGDMEFTRGNLALRDHRENEKRVFLFENTKKDKRFVRFESELELYDVDYFETQDSNGELRVGIKFFFTRAGVYLNILPEQLTSSKVISPNVQFEIFKPNETEKSGLVITRVGQGAYRKSILHRWEYQCAVTKFDDVRVLIASHIVPWRDASDEQRLDVDNGILLSPTYDALFDRHLITFDNRSGMIILSGQIEKKSFLKIGVTGKERLRKISGGNREYLDIHHQQFLVN